MRAGLPMIASDIGGVKEAVMHGETGFVVKGANAYELAGYLQKLITLPELRPKMGQDKQALLSLVEAYFGPVGKDIRGFFGKKRCLM